MDANRLVVLHVDGMMCMKNCGTTVQNALRQHPDVRFAYVDYQAKEARVLVPADVANLATVEAQVIEVVETIGFDAHGRREFQGLNARDLIVLHFTVEGMMCMKNCGNTVINAVKMISGVAYVGIHLDTKTVEVIGAPALDVSEIIEAIELVGFDCALRTKEQDLELASKTSSSVPPPPAVQEPPKDITIDTNLPRASIQVGGMSCAACVRSIETVLMEKDGIVDCRVGLIAQKAEVAFDPEIVNEQDITDLIKEAGYQATFLELLKDSDGTQLVELRVPGIQHPDTMEAHLKALDGVASVSIFLPEQRVEVELRPMSAIGPRGLLECIHELGYSASLIESKNAPGKGIQEAGLEEVRKWKHLFTTSLLFAAPAMLIHMVLGHIEPFRSFLHQSIRHHVTLQTLIMFCLVIPVQFGVGKRFYVAAYKGLQHNMMGMDFLIVTGTSLAFLYSVSSMIFSFIDPTFIGHYFFESSAMLITFVTFGKYLESIAKGKTADALAHLVNLQPRFAILVDPRGKTFAEATPISDIIASSREREIPVELVQRGDLLRVAPGGSVPIDGKIEYGASTIDESMITGESMPVVKKVGDYVFGSTLNQHGVLYVRSKSNGGSDSALAQICSLIEEAQVNKAPIQAYADRIACVFAPTVLCISVFTFFFWFIASEMNWIPQEWKGGPTSTEDQDNFLFALLFSISVIVIACPCALGLATPTAVMVGCGVGAKNGILIKGGGTLEIANDVDTVVLDKTGTLTMGKPSVIDVLALHRSYTPKQMLYYAASAETASEHPLATAIVNTAIDQERLTLGSPSDFSIKPGRGLQCVVDKKAVVIGNIEWMEEHNVQVAKKAEGLMSGFEDEGKTVVCIAIDEELAGIISIADIPRREAKSVVDALKNMGMQVWMITGDNLRTATSIAHKLGIDHVKAVAMPGEKVNQIRQLQAQGRTVAMVGDGINDAPALAQADVGIAIGAGTEIAVAQADMILVKSNLCDIVTAFDLSRAVFARIRWNFVFSMGYNILGIPLAAGVFYPILHATLPPLFAGLAMAFSSVSVVLSSLMLKQYRPPNIMSTKPAQFHSPVKPSAITQARKLPSISVPSLSQKYEPLQTMDDPIADVY